eukprot:3213653-Pleurochrysis_carterae.AAC.1
MRRAAASESHSGSFPSGLVLPSVTACTDAGEPHSKPSPPSCGGKDADAAAALESRISPLVRASLLSQRGAHRPSGSSAFGPLSGAVSLHCARVAV